MEAALKIVPELYAPRKLDIASGLHPAKGYTGIDLEPNSDIVWDLFDFPWPIRSGSVSAVRINHFLEHIPHTHPGWIKDGWFMFWEEVYRITRKGAVIDATSPYVKSDRTWWDPTHVRPIHEVNFYYLTPDWRDANFLGHYTSVDFEPLVLAYSGLADDMAGRNEEYVAFHRMHSWNVHPDLVVKLKRR